MPWPIGEDHGGGKRIAQAAERNKEPILAVLRRVLPQAGLMVEVGSGTGQHVTHFARALPALQWQPTDVDPELRRSVALWIRDEKLSNILDPIALDVQDRPWTVERADAVVCINMIHVAPWRSTLALFDGARAMGSKVLFLYGPYRRFGAHTAPSNEQFDASLRANDATWGIRDLEAVEEVAAQNGLVLKEVVEMPANNLSLVFERQVV
jgi:hypothetical protein